MDVTNIRVPLINLKPEFYMNSQKLGSIDNSIDRNITPRKTKKKKAFVINSLQFRKKVSLFDLMYYLLQIRESHLAIHQCKINFSFIFEYSAFDENIPAFLLC